MASLDYDSEDESEEQLDWLLGFFDPPRKPTDLLRHRFPSKVGGRPAWLDPVHLPVYAPVDAVPHAFHRSVYVFISPNGSKLAQEGAVRALRCQLPRHNPFYGHEPARKDDLWPPPLPPDQHAAALALDPWTAAAYESATSQRQHICDSGSAAPPEELAAIHASPALLPEAELVVEPEPGSSSEDDAKMQALLGQYKQHTAEEGEYDEDELPSAVVDSVEESLRPEQRHFAAFAARVAKDPEQVLRYCFDDAARPLCPSSAGIPGPADIPPCQRCGAARCFEFQIMPQLLNHLGADAADPQAPDWGTIAVYCCSASCDSGISSSEATKDGGSAYVEEFAWVQPSA